MKAEPLTKDKMMKAYSLYEDIKNCLDNPDYEVENEFWIKRKSILSAVEWFRKELIGLAYPLDKKTNQLVKTKVDHIKVEMLLDKAFEGVRE